MMPPDALISAKMHQNAFGGRAPPRPTGVAYSAPPDPIAGIKGPTSKGKAVGKCAKFCIPIWGIEAPVYLGLFTELSCDIIYDVIIKFECMIAGVG